MTTWAYHRTHLTGDDGSIVGTRIWENSCVPQGLVDGRGMVNLDIPVLATADLQFFSSSLLQKSSTTVVLFREASQELS